MSSHAIACIAGGTSGIGRATTLRLLAKGWDVISIGRTVEHATELSNIVASHEAPRLSVKSADLCSYEECEALAEYLNVRYGKLDVLVNAAGTIGAGGVQEETPDRWGQVIASNLTPAFNMTKACCGLLKSASGASIVNISSVCSLRPCASISYSVSKAGLDMFTKAAARELAPFGIRVNSVNPSVVRSNLQMSAGLFANVESYEDWIKKMGPSHPLGRIGEPEDVVGAIEYLTSPDASWMTGAIVSLDGGRAIA